MKEVKKYRKIKNLNRFLSICLSFICITIFYSPANAMDVKGFAVYRNGCFFNPSGHAGLVYDSNKTIIHVDKTLSRLIQTCELNDFVNDRQFFGYYVPKKLKMLQSYDLQTVLNNVINIADILKKIPTAHLSYSLVLQIDYESNKNGTENSNCLVDPDEIASMRCDGLVEYCYEYTSAKLTQAMKETYPEFDLLIYGQNIAYFNFSIRDNHSAPFITPKQQIKHYLQNCLGDVNHDLNVDSADSRLVLNYSSSTSGSLENNPLYYEYVNFVSDVDGDHMITAADARLILRFSTGLETSFPGDPYP